MSTTSRQKKEAHTAQTQTGKHRTDTETDAYKTEPVTWLMTFTITVVSFLFWFHLPKSILFSGLDINNKITCMETRWTHSHRGVRYGFLQMLCACSLSSCVSASFWLVKTLKQEEFINERLSVARDDLITQINPWKGVGQISPLPLNAVANMLVLLSGLDTEEKLNIYFHCFEKIKS